MDQDVMIDRARDVVAFVMLLFALANITRLGGWVLLIGGVVLVPATADIVRTQQRVYIDPKLPVGIGVLCLALGSLLLAVL